jgi:hypothetical protein
MEKFVYNYLSQTYYLATSDVGNDGIYLLLDTRKHKSPVYGSRITKDISTIFGLGIEDAKVLINSWAIIVNPKVDLEFYWQTNEDIFDNVFPLVQAVASRTIGMDLVSVQPMSGPRVELLYLDYVYKQETRYQKIKNKVIRFFKNIYSRIFGLFKNK